MEYFLLLPDQRIVNPLSFTAQESDLRAEQPYAMSTETTSNTVVVDFIIKRIVFNSYFFVADELMKVLGMYDENIDFMPICVINQNQSIQKVYWQTDIAEETKDAVANKFTEVSAMQVYEKALKGKPIHRIHYEKQVYILVNHCVAESILRRLPVGIWLQEVKVLREVA